MIREHTSTSAPAVSTPPRPARGLAYRTAGQTHGPITRLMSPGDLGELVKPFVFLDHFGSENFPGGGFPMHPHSGIATHTTLLQGSTTYRDSTGKSGRLDGGSVEWMQAGGGVWHTGAPIRGEPIRGFQLWVALPAALENAPAESHYIDAPTIPGDGPVRVLLGAYGGLKSPIPFDAPMTYLHVRLRDGEAWSFDPPEGHDLAWLAVSVGALRVADTTVRREMVVFEEGDGRVDLVAVGDTELVLGSAVKHPHPLVLGSYSVHTSVDALRRGVAGIRQLAAEGKNV